MDHFEEAITLATGKNGVVKICPPGCIHLLFQKVTVNFDSPAEFQEMVGLVKSKVGSHTADENFTMPLGEIGISVGPLALKEILELFEDASAALAWSDGDLKFADETINRFLRNNHLSE